MRDQCGNATSHLNKPTMLKVRPSQPGCTAPHREPLSHLRKAPHLFSMPASRVATVVKRHVHTKLDKTQALALSRSSSASCARLVDASPRTCVIGGRRKDVASMSMGTDMQRRCNRLDGHQPNLLAHRAVLAVVRYPGVRMQHSKNATGPRKGWLTRSSSARAFARSSFRAAWELSAAFSLAAASCRGR